MESKRIKQLEDKYHVDILIGTRDRPTELSLLLQSLRTQSFQSFSIFILEDASGTPMQNYHFLMSLINRMKLENHAVHIMRNNISYGISKMRDQMVKWSIKEGNGNLIARIDDDCIVEPNFLEKLLEGIEAGYDLVSGLTPPIMQPRQLRENKFVKPIINKIILDKEGNFEKFGDDCGFGYIDDELIPTEHFRSSALYKKSVHDKVNYITNITACGFREEEFFSFKLITNGYLLAVHTGAIAFHIMTPSGGDRRANYNELAMKNHEYLCDFTKKLYKKYGDFITNYNNLLKKKGFI